MANTTATQAPKQPSEVTQELQSQPPASPWELPLGDGSALCCWLAGQGRTRAVRDKSLIVIFIYIYICILITALLSLYPFRYFQEKSLLNLLLHIPEY